VRTSRFGLKTLYLTASSDHTLKGGMVKNHTNYNINYLAIESAVEALRTKIIYYLFLTGN
jgi:hypothetical protein